MPSSRLLTLLALPTRLLSLLLSTTLTTLTLLLITRASPPPPQIITVLAFSLLTLLQTLLTLLLHHSTSTPHQHHPPYLLLGDVLGVVGYAVSVLLVRGVGGRWGCVPAWGSVSSAESGSGAEKGATDGSGNGSGSGSGRGTILRLRVRGLALESDDSSDIFDHTIAGTGSTNTDTLSTEIGGVGAPATLGGTSATITTSTSTCHTLDATFILAILACGVCILTLALGVLMRKAQESERRRDVERARWEVEEASGFGKRGQGKQGERGVVEVRRLGSRGS
ncbi:hypothetical protein EX30DRAFT_386896 [Ascodesmis nigricans]|uniref:Uncharacterized protein n=1 Tax=Ascodesmis nigricans TaxID=341454 RepID=A0A4S2N0D8_9PEZI|nr:hypothetical protein EX30DRAFT_386896 [Ascodesmis nigricans]